MAAHDGELGQISAPLPTEKRCTVCVCHKTSTQTPNPLPSAHSCDPPRTNILFGCCNAHGVSVRSCLHTLQLEEENLFNIKWKCLIDRNTTNISPPSKKPNFKLSTALQRSPAQYLPNNAKRLSVYVSNYLSPCLTMASLNQHDIKEIHFFLYEHDKRGINLRLW